MKEFLNMLVTLDIKGLFRNRTTNAYVQFFRYIFVGGFAFLTDAFVLWLCEKVMYYMFAAAVAFVAGLTVNYLLSVAFVFSESKQVKNRAREFLVYAVIGIIGLGLTEIIMYILTDLCHFYFMFSKVISAIIVLIWNFVARKKILYTNRGENI